jgi:tetratricopeptide (TPR) repeat protein
VEAERAVAGYLQQAALLQEQGRWDEAAQVLARAEERLGGGGPAGLVEQVRHLRDDADWVAELEEARLCAAEASPDRRFAFSYAGADRAYREAFVRRGLDFGSLDPGVAAARIRGFAIRSRLVEALDVWADVKERLRAGSGEELRLAASRADDDAWRQRLRKLMMGKDQAAVEQLAGEEGSFAQPPANLVLLGRALEAAGGQAAAERLLRGAQELHPGDFWNNLELAKVLTRADRFEEAVGFFRAALAVRSRSAVVHYNLSVALVSQGKLVEAEHACRKAIALKPDFHLAYYGLGNALVPQGKLAEAEAAFRKAIAFLPNFPQAYNYLGTTLVPQRRLGEAEAAFRKAIALQPDFPMYHCNLGNTLVAEGKVAQAEAAFRKAVALKPGFPEAHSGLGYVLWAQGKLAEAEDACRKAIALRPDLPQAYCNLGYTLASKRQLDEAEGAFRKAIALKPDFPEAHCNLGNTLVARGKLADAEAALRQAIALKLDYPEAHSNLGVALRAQGKLAEAEDACRKAIALRPDLANAHCNLAQALRDQGRFVDALAALKHGHELGSRNPRQWPYPSEQWVQQLERLVQLDTKLPAILSGKEQPADAAERIALAELCQMPCKKRYAAAARFFDEAFTAEPNRAGDRPSAARYNAACAAALAGCGHGQDADTLDTTARARLRQQALDWLRADLAAWQWVLDGGRSKTAPAVRQQMQHWLGDGDFAGVRGAQALARLPEAEREAWRKLWEDVAATLARAQKEMAPDQKATDR